jgi:aspartate aminotransferase
MPFASNAFGATIADSPTLAMSDKARALTQAGHPVINLSVGEPDLPIPSWIRQGAIAAIERGEHTYTPTAGLAELRRAVVAKLQRENQLMSYGPEQVIVGQGAKHVLFNALMVAVQPGQEVVIPAPYWVSYPTMVTMAKGVPCVVSCSAEQGFKLTPDQLRASLHDHTGCLILNSPSNPTGAVYSANEWMALAQVLRDFPHVSIVCDDIYEHLTYHPNAFTTLLNVAPDLADRTLLVNGVSKSFSMTGWRVGYGVGPRAWIDPMIRLQSHSTSGICCIAQWATIEALNNPESSTYLAQLRTVFQKRRDILVQGLQTISSVDVPMGAFYVFFDARPLMQRLGISHDRDLANRWLEEALICTVPGSEFGMPGFIRLSYAINEQDVQQAVDRLVHWAQGA